MTLIKYGSPTFLFRDTCADNLEGIICRLAACGFDGLELFSMFGHTPAVINKLKSKYGIQIICDHINYTEFVKDPIQVLESRSAIGAKYITIMSIPEENLPGSTGYQDTLKQIERIGLLCTEYGIQLLYHSHGYDLIRKYDDKSILEYLLDTTNPKLLKFQPDLGWITLGGGDPEYFLDKYTDRCPIIHLKDYYAADNVLLQSAAELGEKRGGPEYQYFEFRPSGFGIMNFPKLMPKILKCKPEWIVTDHDLSYERDAFEEMQISLEYVKKLVSLYI